MKVRKERIYKTRDQIEAELAEWERKLEHAQQRRCELISRWGELPEDRRGLLAEFIERLDADIEWMQNEKGLCRLELQGMED